jgi:serine/threonine-protein kinase HipA
MKRTLQVYVGNDGRIVGTLHYDQNGAREHAVFVYAETWLADADRFALEPNLPLVTGSQFHRKTPAGSVFHAAMADTEPDGWGRRVILRDHAFSTRSAASGGSRRPSISIRFRIARAS